VIINSQKLSKEITNAKKEMQLHPMIEETRFAISEKNGIQVQIVITKDEEEHLCEIKHGITCTKKDSASYTLMPAELTAENGAKALLIGEFNTEHSIECHECEGLGHYDTEEMEECDDCEGRGAFINKTPIDWPTIKKIYAMAVKGLQIK